MNDWQMLSNRAEVIPESVENLIDDIAEILESQRQFHLFKYCLDGEEKIYFENKRNIIDKLLAEHNLEIYSENKKMIHIRYKH